MTPCIHVTKHQICTKLLYVGLLAACISMVSCADNDDDNADEVTLTGDTRTDVLHSVSNPAISGTVKFSELKDHSTLIIIDLEGTTPGDSYPAHIHANT